MRPTRAGTSINHSVTGFGEPALKFEIFYVIFCLLTSTGRRACLVAEGRFIGFSMGGCVEFGIYRGAKRVPLLVGKVSCVGVIYQQANGQN
jgi:hypothetical protein